MRNTAFCMYENKGAAQLCDNRAADQHLCSRYIVLIEQSLIYLNPNFKPLLFCTALFVLDIVVNPEDMFSQDIAHN